MNNEEFQKRMEFLRQQRLQFASDIQLLRNAQAMTESIIARLANVSTEGFWRVNPKINKLADSQMLTHEALRNLTAKVDRYLSERNGN